MSGRQPFRLEEPWRTKAAVPEAVWEGNRWSHPGYTDEEYLAALNNEYYWYWVRDDAKKAAQKGALLLNGQAPLVLCGGDRCSVKIKRSDWREGKRLCLACQAEVRTKGQVGHIGYAGEMEASTL